MTRLEKIAWFNIRIFGIAFIVFVILFALFSVSKPDLSLIRRLHMATASIGICGFWGLSPFLFRKKETDEITLDERDLAIARRSTFIGHLTFWIFFCAVAMGVWGAYQSLGINKISVDFLPFLVFMGMVILVTSQSISLLFFIQTWKCKLNHFWRFEKCHVMKKSRGSILLCSV